MKLAWKLQTSQASQRRSTSLWVVGGFALDKERGHLGDEYGKDTRVLIKQRIDKTFGESDEPKAPSDTLPNGAAIAADQSGNERAVRVAKMSSFVKRNHHPQASAC